MSLVSDALFPTGAPHKGMATAEEPTPFLFFPYFNSFPCISASFSCTSLSCFISHKWPASPIWSFNLTQICFFHKLNFSYSQCDQIISRYSFPPIPPLHLYIYSWHFSYKSLHCSHCSITTIQYPYHLISSASSLDCCALIFIPDPYINIGRRILFLMPLLTSVKRKGKTYTVLH